MPLSMIDETDDILNMPDLELYGNRPLEVINSAKDGHQSATKSQKEQDAADEANLDELEQ